MSYPLEITQKCAICKKKSTQTILASSSTFGPSDLDKRPPEMLRSTMWCWIQECPHCGYISGDIEKKVKINKKWLQSEEYINGNGVKFSSYLAKKFYKQFLICLQAEDTKGAFFAALHAAWVCDDTRDFDNAVFCRILALEMLKELLKSPDAEEDLVIIRADLLRRTCDFDTLIEEYQNKKFSSDLLDQIIAFQIEKAKVRDDRCYTVGDVMANEQD